MSLGISQVQPPSNEPVQSCAPGSPERAELQAELARLREALEKLAESLQDRK